MAKRVQRRRGTTAEHSSFTGAVGEISVDTTKDTIAVHDGSQAGGFPLAREDMNNVTNRIGITQLNVSDGSNGQVLTTNGSGTLSFSTVDATTANVGGDLSGTVGNAQIVANAVGTTELAANAVTTVKVTDANITAAKLATNSVTTIKITDANVTTAKIADSAITSVKILDGTIVAGDLASDSVTSIKILDGNVTGAKIANDAIDSQHYTDGSIDAAHIANDSVDSQHYVAASIDNEHLANNSVTTSRISDDAITSVKIADTTLASLNAYDIAFTAGFDKDMVKEDVAIATYGELVMARAGTFIGTAGYIDTAGTGTNSTNVNIYKNGTTIFSPEPKFNPGSTSLTPGALSTTTFVSGDRITFKITSLCAVTPGQGVRFTLKCKLTE